MPERLVYLISPVRQVTDEQTERILNYKKELEEAGAKVFNPAEDAPQQDETGYNIVAAEVNFMKRISDEGGRTDLLWNAGGKPSEGSRVDFGIAYALGLELRLVDVFNTNEVTGPQETLNLLLDLLQGVDSSRVFKLNRMLEKIVVDKEAVIDWDVDMQTEEQEWQRIFLGLALGLKARDPNIKIKMGKLLGDEPPGKCYPKVVREIEKRQKQLLPIFYARYRTS